MALSALSFHAVFECVTGSLKRIFKYTLGTPPWELRTLAPCTDYFDLKCHDSYTAFISLVTFSFCNFFWGSSQYLLLTTLTFDFSHSADVLSVCLCFLLRISSDFFYFFHIYFFHFLLFCAHLLPLYFPFQ